MIVIEKTIAGGEHYFLKCPMKLKWYFGAEH